MTQYMTTTRLLVSMMAAFWFPFVILQASSCHSSDGPKFKYLEILAFYIHGFYGRMLGPSNTRLNLSYELAASTMR